MELEGGPRICLSWCGSSFSPAASGQSSYFVDETDDDAPRGREKVTLDGGGLMLVTVFVIRKW